MRKHISDTQWLKCKFGAYELWHGPGPLTVDSCMVWGLDLLFDRGPIA